MKRIRALVLAVVAVGATLVPSPAAQVNAHEGHARPRITVMRWKEAPVTVSEPCEDPAVCEEEVLVLRAHDPDSSITEIQVWFDENGDRAPFVMAHTYCLQGRRPGEPARLEIGATFTEPGEYTVAAVAYSHRRCSPHERGDAHRIRHSPIKRLITTVEP